MLRQECRRRNARNWRDNLYLPRMPDRGTASAAESTGGEGAQNGCCCVGCAPLRARQLLLSTHSAAMSGFQERRSRDVLNVQSLCESSQCLGLLWGVSRVLECRRWCCPTGRARHLPRTVPDRNVAPTPAKAFAPGTLANYWSRSQGKWMPVKVKKYFAKDNRYELYHASPPYHPYKKSADAGRIQLQGAPPKTSSPESSVVPPQQAASALGPTARVRPPPGLGQALGSPPLRETSSSNV